MAVVITPRYEYIPQARAYPKDEWTWRGIVDPKITDPTYGGNACLTTVGVSGTVIGYDKGLGIGTVKPEQAEDGTIWYSFTWDYPAVKGVFSLTWGADGKHKIPDVDGILIKEPFGNKTWVATWDDTANAYLFTDLTKAGELNTMYDAGELNEFCFTMLILPTEFIRISYTEMLIGA